MVLVKIIVMLVAVLQGVPASKIDTYIDAMSKLYQGKTIARQNVADIFADNAMFVLGNNEHVQEWSIAEGFNTLACEWLLGIDLPLSRQSLVVDYVDSPLSDVTMILYIEAVDSSRRKHALTQQHRLRFDDNGKINQIVIDYIAKKGENLLRTAQPGTIALCQDIII